MSKLSRCTRSFGKCQTRWGSPSMVRRGLQISASSRSRDEDVQHARLPLRGLTKEARFEVIGAQSSLLSVFLAPSQTFHTRRGTVIGLEGKPDGVTSTLSFIKPIRRFVQRIPFLYQRLVATSDLKLLIAGKSKNTAMAVIHMDGTKDWTVCGDGLLAWTGRTLSLSPSFGVKTGLPRKSSTEINGRGLIALAGTGGLVQLELEAGDSYIVHPSNLVAYSTNDKAPLPYRLPTAFPRLQIPDMSSFRPKSRFPSAMRESNTWKTAASLLFNLRAWSRAIVWGDRLFLEFQGPATMLIQSHSRRLRDVLSAKDVNEIAEAPPSSLQGLRAQLNKADSPQAVVTKLDDNTLNKAPKLKTATVGSNGVATFKDL